MANKMEIKDFLNSVKISDSKKSILLKRLSGVAQDDKDVLKEEQLNIVFEGMQVLQVYFTKKITGHS